MVTLNRHSINGYSINWIQFWIHSKNGVRFSEKNVFKLQVLNLFTIYWNLSYDITVVCLPWLMLSTANRLFDLPSQNLKLVSLTESEYGFNNLAHWQAAGNDDCCMYLCVYML